jgi:hypothetical protein
MVQVIMNPNRPVPAGDGETSGLKTIFVAGLTATALLT